MLPTSIGHEFRPLACSGGAIARYVICHGIIIIVIIVIATAIIIVATIIIVFAVAMCSSKAFPRFSHTHHESFHRNCSRRAAVA